MDRSMMTSAVSMGELQKALDTVANNLANVSTTGFKQRQTAFSSLLEQNLTDQPDATNQLGRDTAVGLRIGQGSKVSGTNTDMSAGAPKQTGRLLDVALLKPEQFFSVETRDAKGQTETRYTRNGAFYIQPDAANKNMADLVTANGAFVLDQNGKPLQVPANAQSVTIDQTGALQVTLNNGAQQSPGRLGIVAISRPQLLNSVGDSTFTLPNLTSLNIPTANVLTRVSPQNVSLQTGALEQSNVDMATAMTQLTELERAYQLNAKAVTISDNMMNLINNLK